MSEALPPKTRAIGRYTILRELRRERHSVSYAAVDPVMNRQLVVKAVELLPAGPRLSAEERRRVEQAFVRQAQAAGRLQHPHIVTVFDAGLSHAFGFLVIERVNGRQLHDLIAGGLRPAFVQCASIAARIADALECAHNNGVAHGHLGPQHVYLLADGTPKVSGFGGWIDDGATGDEALAGTARLLPYFQNEITDETRRRDIRAIGELLFMLLAGRAPPDERVGGSATAAQDGRSTTLAARPDTPVTLARLADQALQTAAGIGPRTAGAMRDALTSFIWNERTENVAPSSLGIPLAAPPQRAPVHVATISPADNIAPLREPAPDARPKEEVRTAPAPSPATLPRPAVPDPLSLASVIGLNLEAVSEQLQPWAARNRLPLFTAGALLIAGIFLGVVLGNLRHPESAAASSSAQAAPAVDANPALSATAAAVPATAAPVLFTIQPWGEVFIDGKAIGVAPPLNRVELPGGHHHIEVRHAPYPAWQTEIDIQGPAPIAVEHGFP